MVIDPERNSISQSGNPISSSQNQEPGTRAKASLIVIHFTRLAFGLVVITLPWRQRLVLQPRPTPPLYADFTDLLLFTHDLFLIALLFLWGTSLALRPRRLATGPFFIWLPLLGLTAMAVVSAATSVDPPLAAYHAFHLVSLAVLYFYIVNQIRRLSDVAWALAVQIGLQTAVGLAQVWRQRELGLAWLGEHRLDPAAGSAFVWAEGGLRSLRAYGLADHPNILAAALAFAVLLLAIWAVTSSSRRRIAAVVLCAFGGVALFLTFSRHAWIAFAVGALLAAALFARSEQARLLQRWLVLLALMALALLPTVWLALPYLRLGTSETIIVAQVEERLHEAAERDALNRITNNLFINHAITGVGISVLPLALQQQTPNFSFDYQPARVTVLDAAAEVGLIGALFYFVLLLAPWLALAFNRERLAFSPTLIGVTAVLAAITVFNVFDAYAWSYPSGRLWQWLIWALWAVAYQEAGDKAESSQGNLVSLQHDNPYSAGATHA